MATGPGAAAASAATKYTIELIPGLTVDPFYITMHYGAEQEAAKLGVTLKWAGATTFSPTTQIPVVNSVLASKPSALLIAPTDTHALFAPMNAYVKAGIPVIAVDTTLANTSILTSAISSDNYQGGEKAADTIASLAHDKGDVAVINVMPNVSTTDLRQAGFLAEMKKYPNMKVVAHVYDQDSPPRLSPRRGASSWPTPGWSASSGPTCTLPKERARVLTPPAIKARSTWPATTPNPSRSTCSSKAL